MNAEFRLAHGNQFPYDADDKWWNDDGENPPPPKDWAHRAARGILAELQDRRGLGSILEELDEELRAEIVTNISEIIRMAEIEKARGE